MAGSNGRWGPEVGQTIAFCRLSTFLPLPAADRPRRAMVCPTTMGAVAKRLMMAVVGAGIGALAGVLIDYLGAGTPARWAGAAAGALIPQFVLGPPGH